MTRYMHLGVCKTRKNSLKYRLKIKLEKSFIAYSKKSSLKPYKDIKEKINPDDPIYICFDLITRIILSSGKEATFFKKLHFVYTIPFLKR